MESYQLLENQLSEIENAEAVVVNSGTAALHLALACLDLPKGSEVLVPEFTMIACARAVTLAGLKPVFVDCRDDLLMDLTKANEKRTDLTRAVMPVHIYGRRLEAQFATGLACVEDRAECQGIRFDNSRCDVACYSFYKNKIVAGEEGGALITRNRDLAEKARKLRSLGFDDNHDFLHIPGGMNYRMPNKQAQLVIYSLGMMRGNIMKRRQAEKLYDELIPNDWKMPKRDVPWVYDLRIPGMVKTQQDFLVKSLRLLGIEARHGFKPMSIQPEYFASGFTLLNAYRLSQEIVYLPLSPGLTESVVRSSAHELKRIVKELGL